MPTIDVKIPPVGESILTGVLARWRVADGDIVARDQPLFELETDKITSEGMAEAAGKITLGTAEGTEVKIGEVVATIDTENKGLKAERLKAERPEPEPETPQENPLAAFAASVSPAVARIVAETGIDPATVPGTGKGGRVTKADLLAAAEAAPAIPPPPPAGRQTRKKLSPLRKRLAER
ncbi:MAG: E3 binding domain-containing protein, partial [Opitutaceae bacterium]|nr:E3 binding domain-containing protein [Opitutaceae bacterium]